MKVLMVAHDAIPFSMGGVEVYVDGLAGQLSRSGASVEVVAAVDRGPTNTYETAGHPRDGFRLTTIAHRTGRDRFHMLRLAWDISLFDRNPRIDRLVVGLAREIRPDVVHVHHLVHLSSSLVGALQTEGFRVVVTLHDYWWLCIAGQLLNGDGPHEPQQCTEACLLYLVGNRHKAAGPMRSLVKTYIRMRASYFSRFVRGRQRALVGELNRASAVIAPSRDIRDRHVGAGLDPRRVVLSDYGFERSGIERRLRGTRPGPVRFGFLGRLVPEKGPHLLIEAFESTPLDATLAIHGVPHDPAFEAELRALAKSSRVTFAGSFPNEEIARVLDGLDVLVVPSIWRENSPLVIHEAFLAGVPVVTARAGGMEELVEDGVSGLLFELGDAADLARALARMLEPGVLARLSRGAPPVKTMEENAAELLDLYASIAQGASGGLAAAAS